MAQRTLVVLEDDLDGSEATETIEFGLDGAQYSIDLSDTNADSLRKALDEYIAHARRTGGRRRSTRRVPAKPAIVFSEVDNKAVRAWAASAGVEVSSRGRIPAHVIAAYREAGY